MIQKLTKEDLSQLTRKPETFHVEFKEAKNAIPSSFWESYSAFANTDGGFIILGVKEGTDGSFCIQGVADADRLAQEIWNTINNRQKVSANVLFNRCIYSVVCDGGATVLVVDVPRGTRQEQPVFLGANPYGGTYRRNGEGDYRCSKESVNAMIRDNGQFNADQCLVERLTVQDLNQDTIRRYRTLFRQCRPDNPWINLEDDEFLVRLGAAMKDDAGIVRPNRAGLLFFGNFIDIQNEMPHYFLDYREKLDANPRYSDRVCPFDLTWSGNIFDFYFQIVSRLTVDVKKSFKLDDRLLRIDDTPVHKALRECLANTLIHADYMGRQGIVIEKNFRRITFSNPGLLRIPKQTAIAGGTSDARNDRIFTMFALVDIGEKLGTGLVQLFSLWKQNHWPTPILREQWEPERTILELEYGEPDKSSDAPPALQTQHGVTLASNPQTGIENMGSGTASQEGGPEPTESGTASQESGPEPTENGTVSQESGSEPTENGTVSQESGSEPTENGTVSQESGPEPTESGTVNSESGPEPEPTENGTVSQESSTVNSGSGTEDRIEAQNRRILQLLHDQPEASIVEMRRRIGLSERTIKRRLAELKQQGRLRRIGSDRKGHWEVMEH